MRPCVALVVSGFDLKALTFVGFLPRAGSARKRALARVAEAAGAVVLYEAPRRVRATLAELAETPGERAVCVAREMTKKFEEIRMFASVKEAVDAYEGEEEPRGEFVLVLGPPKKKEREEDVDEMEVADVNARGMARALLEEGVPVKAIAKSIGAVANLPKKAVYKYVSELKEEMQLTSTR